MELHLLHHVLKGKSALSLYMSIDRKVGDRIRYHLQLAFKYEKYDKSHDRVIPCMFCKTMNDIRKDRCKACKSLLFK